MKKIRVTLILLLSLCCLFLVACWRRDLTYDGDNPELFSVALHSLLGVRGYEGGHLQSARIFVLEEDSYGRVLFSYDEDRVSSRLIIQRIEGDYAYFYPHYNFILQNFIDDTEALKEANSWNQPMSDANEFERVSIIRLKEEGPIALVILNDVYSELFPQVTSRINRGDLSYRMNFLRTDRYGRSVYLAIGTGIERQRNPIAVMFQPDHSFDLEVGVLEIGDMNNYQTELRLFMEANGWNEPWEE